MQFGADLVAYVQGTMEANDVLATMDGYRAEGAHNAGDPAWK
jgi:raffinose/stachyose/melibiose transport system substrate-binding protein